MFIAKVLESILLNCFSQSPILNFTPRGKLWPQGQSCPPGLNFVPWGLSPGGQIICSPLHSSKQQSVHPWGEWRGEHSP
jgi:hypothetical protein